jgi:hypothetical protein
MNPCDAAAGPSLMGPMGPTDPSSPSGPGDSYGTHWVLFAGSGLPGQLPKPPSDSQQRVLSHFTHDESRTVGTRKQVGPGHPLGRRSTSATHVPEGPKGGRDGCAVVNYCVGGSHPGYRPRCGRNLFSAISGTLKLSDQAATSMI